MATKQNYVKKMEVKNKLKIDAGIISDRFPSVAGMVIKMTYYHNAENPILMYRTVNFFPESHAFFNLECMIKGCEEGGFDLKRIISKQIKDKKKVIKGEMSCKAKPGDLPVNHSSIDYKITISYSKKTKKAAVKSKQKTETKTTKTEVKPKKKTSKKTEVKSKQKTKTKTTKTAVKPKKKTSKKTAVKTKKKAATKAKKK